MNTIEGPYEFGEHAPGHLMGWAGPDMEAVALDEQQAAGTVIAYSDYRRIAEEQSQGEDVTEPTGMFIWDYAQKLLGRHVPTEYQQTGDCVGAGIVGTVNDRSAYEICALYQEEKWRRAYIPFVYGMSRTASDLGNGRLGRSAGSTGAWGAGALRKYGCLFHDDEGVPPYTGKVSDDWGRGSGPPQWARDIAKDNPMLKTARLTTIEEVRHELINFRPCTIASNRGFKMQPRELKGFHVFVPSGSWAHQTRLNAWMDGPIEAAHRPNSWNERAHGTPIAPDGFSLPAPGGAWNLSEHLEREMRSGGCEVYAMSLFAGHPSKPDPGIL